MSKGNSITLHNYVKENSDFLDLSSKLFEELSSAPKKPLAKLPDGETIVGMCEHKGSIFVASNKNVYVLSEEGKLEAVMFKGDL